ncbi:MAG TPA: spore germination protein GerW family protein [Jatrophihabitans sp.]|jgi:uncharacterized spore protein YtfJ
MKVDQLIATARETMTVRRVFGEPYEKDGVTVIASARVSGGAGGGGGHDQQGQEGEGGGFGVQARPAGAYIIKDGRVRWMPAVDVNRVMTVIGTVLVALLVTRARIVRLRTRAGITNA